MIEKTSALLASVKKDKQSEMSALKPAIVPSLALNDLTVVRTAMEATGIAQAIALVSQNVNLKIFRSLNDITPSFGFGFRHLKKLSFRSTLSA